MSFLRGGTRRGKDLSHRVRGAKRGRAAVNGGAGRVAVIPQTYPEWYTHASRPFGAEGWVRAQRLVCCTRAWPLRPFFVAVRRLSSYADAAMRSVLIRSCLVTLYVLVLLEVGMVLGAVT